MIEKNYQPGEIEPRVSAAWEESQAFAAGHPERRRARPYCIVIPPPNITGSLHMGHALNNTLQDVLCRFERMRGRDVLWQPGTDHAGIATQMVVERQLMERQEPPRRAMGREKFLERVWAWKAESGGVIVNQLKRLGASCDWSRERFTMDEGLSRAVLKVFVEVEVGEIVDRACPVDQRRLAVARMPRRDNPILPGQQIKPWPLQREPFPRVQKQEWATFAAFHQLQGRIRDRYRLRHLIFPVVGPSMRLNIIADACGGLALGHIIFPCAREGRVVAGPINIELAQDDPSR